MNTSTSPQWSAGLTPAAPSGAATAPTAPTTAPAQTRRPHVPAPTTAQNRGITLPDLDLQLRGAGGQ